MAWDWKRRGDEVVAARRACVPSGRPGHAEAAARFHRAIDAAWPPGFFEQLERCKRGEPGGLEPVLEFIEACPRFFRTGYALTKALRWVTRPPRMPAQEERLRGIVLGAVTGRLRVPFRNIPSIARAVDAPALRAELQSLRDDPSERVRLHAARVLNNLPGATGSGQH